MDAVRTLIIGRYLHYSRMHDRNRTALQTHAHLTNFRLSRNQYYNLLARE